MKTKKEELEAELTRLNELRKQVKEKLKALPTYELNKWYKHHNGSLYFINNECENGHLYGYGFDNDGDWSVRNNDNYRFCAFNSVAKKEITLASREQVERSLIKEANRRGFKKGCYVSAEWISNRYYDGEIKEENFEYREGSNFLHLNKYVILNNGQWATIIEQDKFAELKEARKNGKVIQVYYRLPYSQMSWNDVVDDDSSVLWNPSLKHRIKPEEKPKLKDSDIAIIERLHDALLDNNGYDLNSKLLSDSRELCKRIQCIIEKGAN